MNSSEFQTHTEQIEQCVQRVNELQDEAARSTALELMQSLMDLHGMAMARMIELLSDSGEPGRTVLTKLGSDPLICGLLVLYAVHPLNLEERVSKAIVKIQVELRKQSASVELIDVSEAVIRVKLQTSGHGSPDALQRKVEQAIREYAPEAVEVIVEGGLSSTFVPLSMIQPAISADSQRGERQ
jgi:hypothetical protein